MSKVLQESVKTYDEQYPTMIPPYSLYMELTEWGTTFLTGDSTVPNLPVFPRNAPRHNGKSRTVLYDYMSIHITFVYFSISLYLYIYIFMSSYYVSSFYAIWTLITVLWDHPSSSPKRSSIMVRSDGP